MQSLKGYTTIAVHWQVVIKLPDIKDPAEAQHEGIGDTPADALILAHQNAVIGANRYGAAKPDPTTAKASLRKCSVSTSANGHIANIDFREVMAGTIESIRTAITNSNAFSS